MNLERIDVADCGDFPSIQKVASTWDRENGMLVDSAIPEGPKFITFAHILKYETFPLADILREMLKIAVDEMKCGVEIEFAADLETGDGPAIFNMLQIRPISTDTRNAEVDWEKIDVSGALISSGSALGTGWIRGVQDIIYLKKESFDALRTVEMAVQMTAMNARMRQEKRGYALIGYGRWGSSIPSLGVPVKWSDIAEARLLVECSLPGFRVEASQGTHFFQNLTSFNVGYVNVDPFSRAADVFDYDSLAALPAVEETEFLRHVRVEEPMEICIDGLRSKAMIKLK